MKMISTQDIVSKWPVGDMIVNMLSEFTYEELDEVVNICERHPDLAAISKYITNENEFIDLTGFVDAIPYCNHVKVLQVVERNSHIMFNIELWGLAEENYLGRISVTLSYGALIMGLHFSPRPGTSNV